MPNVFEPDWDAEQDRPPFRWRRARIGRQAGSEQLGSSLYALPPGAATWPLHVHTANEELLVVLAGRPTLRTLEGERELVPGEAVACVAGRAGAHRVENRTDEGVRLLVVSTMIAPEVNEYPDTGRVWGLSFAPGGVVPPGAAQTLGPAADEVDLLEGES